MKKAKILLMLFAFLLVLSANAFATTVYLPDTAGDAATTVDIPVNIDDATGLAGFQITVQYDSAVLNCTTVLKGSLISTGWDAMTVNAAVPGQIYGSSNSSDLSELNGVSGDLALIRCTVVGPGGTSTSLHFVASPATLLSNGIGDAIPATLEDGSFTINGGCTDNDTDTYAVEGDSCGAIDCNDSDATVYPGAQETCNNVDDDCDIFVDEDLTRATSCGEGACASTGIETCASGTWGDDTCIPGAGSAETCNGIDDDCNGTVDDGIAAVPTNCGVGVCARAGESTCQGGVMVDNCTPGATTGTDNDCDDVDENCNGTSDENYVPTPTTCGVGACASTGEMVCVLPNHALASTCVPRAPQTEGPFGNATCSDSIDNDCDGATDGADIDCLALRAVSVPALVVDAGAVVQIPVNIDDAAGIAGYQVTVTYDSAVLNCTSVVNGALTVGWDEPTVNAAAGEITFLSTDPNLTPLAGGSGSLALVECTAANNLGASTAVTITLTVLSDENGNTIPSSATAGSVTINSCIPTGSEVCDGQDNDCNGTVDDGIAAVPTTCGTGVCARTGQSTCQGGQMVDNCTAGAPTGTDNNCNDVDENCNGTSDENYVPTPTTCGVGACASTGEMVCVLPNHALASTCVPNAPQTEGPSGDATCGDSIDNDCDGATDGADIDCLSLRAVSADDLTVIPGPVSIPVQVDDATGVAGYQVTVTYDAAVLDCSGAADGNLTPGWELTVNPTAGQIIVLGNDPELDELAGGSGILVNLQCTVVGAAGSGTVLNLAGITLVDSIGNVIPSAASAGSITVVSCTPTNGGVEICDGQDNDCNGQTDEGIAPVMLRTTCGEGACKRPAYNECVNGAIAQTCTPGDSAAETCNNIDDDCDGQVDDGVTRQTSCGIGGCANTGTETCTAGVWGGNTCTPASPSAEVCDGQDNDCDGSTDESIAAVRTTCGVGACIARGTAICTDGQMVNSCTPKPAGTETCNRIDDDCNGQVDDGLTTATTCGVGSCGSTGQSSCENGQMVNSCTPGTPSAEVCDGQDNDCDGSTDESIAAKRITCGLGVCKRAGLSTCSGGGWIDSCIPGTPGTEGPLGNATCGDTLDNDCDGAIDAGDANCQ